MKLTLAHSARDWWPRLKALFAPAPTTIPPPKNHARKAHRTTAFFQLP